MKHKHIILLAFCISTSIVGLNAQTLSKSSPEQLGMDVRRLQNADKVIEKAISGKEIPGAVLAVVRHGRMAYLKAYGSKQIFPTIEKMDVNTVFDLASVTKPVATAISAMILIERGELRMQDKVNVFIPNFESWKDGSGKTKDIRVIDLMTHTSGLPSYAPVAMLEKKYGSPAPNGLMEYIATVKRDFEPQTNFQYSCLNYIVLQRIIETVSKKNLRDFAKENIFDVLGMKHTDFKPSGEILKRVAPTQRTVAKV